MLVAGKVGAAVFTGSVPEAWAGSDANKAMGE